MLDLIEICLTNGLALDSISTFTHVAHVKWADQVVNLYERLKHWEISNNSRQTFSKAFNILALKLRVKPKRDSQHRASSVLKELVTQPQSQADLLKDWLMNVDRLPSEEK